MKKFFSFFAALLFAGSMMAGSYTISFKDNGEGKGDSSTSLTSTDVADYVAEGAEYFSAVAVTGKVYLGQGGYGLKFGSSSSAGSITLTLVTPVTPTSIVMNASPWSGTEGSGLLQDSIFATKSTGAKGTFADFTYDYDGATQVTTIVVGTNTKRGYVKSITVNYEGEVTPSAVATPVISGETEFTESTQVSISCTTANAEIYFTVDGTDPTSNSLPYEEPFTLNASATVKAIAYDGENNQSAIASKTFTKVVPPANLGEKTIAEFLTLKNLKDTCILTGVVDSIKNTTYGNLYLSDTTGQVYVYGVLNAAGESKKFADLNVEAGDTLTIKAIYSEFNNAPQVKNAIFVSVKKAQGETPAAEWTEIVFNEAVAAADLPADASFEFEGLHVAITDSENKMAIDANNAYFGTADEYTKYAFRLKTGGKSLNGSKQNFITINVPEDGLLRLAVRTGSGSDSTRTLVLAQGNDTLYNAIVKDADAIEVAVNDSTKIKVFPYVTVPVKAGNVDVAYPENSLNFYSFAFQLTVVPPTPVVAQYEVAEAIAAGLKDDDELFVRGIITKLEFKGKNFAKYGSVNIYVKDATGAEGEFEFYNCYSLNADTFRTSVPNYDPQSSDWTQLREVADENGNAIHVGDTVIAFGKYKLFNSTHELNTGCYLTEIKHAPVVPADTIALDFNVQNTTYAFVDNQYFDEYGTTDIYLSDINVNASTYEFEGDGNYLVLDFYPEDANNVTGIYKSEDETLDLEYTYMLTINGTDTAEVMFADAGIMVSIGQTDKERGVAELAIVGNLISTEGDIYLLSAAIIAYYDFLPEEQGVENVVLDLKAIKKIINGNVVIEKNGVQYNVLGNTVK